MENADVLASPIPPKLRQCSQRQARWRSASYLAGSGRAEVGPVDKNPKRCAWVVLLMLGRAYTPGALVIAESLRALKTKHEIVCMVTDDIPHEVRALLRGTPENPIYDDVVEVPYVVQRTHPFDTKKRAELYSGWIDRSFTKWNCLQLTQYDRVILVDADVVAIANCDDLFELRPPAACYSNPWAYPWQARGGLPNPYLMKCRPGRHGLAYDPPHGARVPASQIEEALRTRSFVGWGAMTLLEPDAAKYEAFLTMLHAAPVFGEEYNAMSGADEIAIAVFYAREGGEWTHIHQRYLAIPWKQNWVSRDIRAYHYHGRKPWDMKPDEWPDLADWWRVADRLAVKHPSLRALFRPEAEAAENAAKTAAKPLDADIAQLQITNDLRAMIIAQAKMGGRHSNKVYAWPAVNRILGRWLMALVNQAGHGSMAGHAAEDSGWARAYRRSTLDDACNVALAADLAKERIVSSPGEAGTMVIAALALVEGRRGRILRSTGATPACNDEALSYGSHFTVPTTPRIRQLIALLGCEKAAATVIRHGVVLGELQGCVRQAHADYLYTDWGVRNEAFASPLDARLFGKEGATYFSVFPDTDEAFGSAGDFFADDNPGRPGSWLFHPPPAEGVVLRAALAAARIVNCAPPRTVFFLVPDRLGVGAAAYKALRENPFCAAELLFEARTPILETPAGAPLDTDTPYAYIALSSFGPSLETRAEVRAGLEGALRHELYAL
ncbi:MAG: hypothetical protein EBU54_01745 [Mycobacteriaceae bacterium]|nr:hypothetical protein [Mycobacteriaceae bacterium]